MTENEHGSSSGTPYQPKFLQKIESAVSTALHLIPQVISTCAHYSFRPNRFIQHSLAAGEDSYEVLPYTFLAITALVVIFTVGFTVGAVVTIAESVANAIDYMGPGTNEGRLLLARQIEAIEDRSFGSILISTAVVVVAVAALARLFSTIAPHYARTRLERALCYAAGGHQIQAVALMSSLVLVLFVSLNYFNIPWISVVFLGTFAYGLVWPVVTASRAIKRVGSRAGWFRSVTLGLLFALVNPAIVGFTVYGATAAPKLLHDWQAELLPRGSPLEYRLPYARGALSGYTYASGALSGHGELLLTVAIEIPSGRPLIIDTDKLSVSSFGGQLHLARLVDSSDGQARVIVIPEGEIKWLKVAVKLSSLDDSERERLVPGGTWSGKLNLGHDDVALNRVQIDL
jgi:hypothetical protein